MIVHIYAKVSQFGSRLFLSNIKRPLHKYEQSSTIHFPPLGNFLNPALALLGQGLRKLPSGKKLNFANHPYLCKGLIKCKNI